MANTFDFGDIVLEQSVGPYTDEILNDENPPSQREVFQPKQGRDLIVLNPDIFPNNGETTIVEERDGRFSLGTYTLNNRDFWENLTFDKKTRGSQINPRNFDGEVQTSFGELVDTPDGPTVSTNQSNYLSVEALPYIIGENNQVIGFDKYYDKELEKSLYKLTTEGTIYFKISAREPGRTSAGNIKLFEDRPNRWWWFDSHIANNTPGTGVYLTSLDWNDGSEKEFTSKPKLLEQTTTFSHNYEDPGFYTITGVVFLYNNNTEKIAWWEKFETNMVINPSDEYNNPFFNYDNFATIGGMDLGSTYMKSLLTLAGFNPFTMEKRESAVIDEYNEFDKIGLIDTIAKFSDSAAEDLDSEMLSSYSDKIFDEDDTLIHNGYINKKYFNTFENSALNDVDVSLTKVYTGVKSMSEMLGFSDPSHDNPNEDFYWKNIIPKNFTFESLTNVQVQQGNDPIDGARVPRTSYQEVIIDEDTSQEWAGGYYYPVLPKLNKLGVFTEVEPNKVLFGLRTAWDGDDKAPITNKDEISDDLILNIDFDQTTTDDLIDKTNLFDITYNQDFQIKLDKDLRVKRFAQDNPDALEQSNTEQAF